MDCFINKKVLVTGHSGFKGTWLCAWLKQLGAEIIGMSHPFGVLFRRHIGVFIPLLRQVW